MVSFEKLFDNAVELLGFDVVKVRVELESDHTENTRKTIVRHMFALEDDPEAHSRLAGAIAMRQVYAMAPLTIEGYLKLFSSYLREDVVSFMNREKNTLQDMLNKMFHRDFELTYFSVGTFVQTYLSRLSHEEPPGEVPQMCWMRVAVGEFLDDGIDAVLDMMERYSSQTCVPASPTIFNMGMRKGGPSSCMLYTMGDSLEDIYDVKKEMAIASKNNAGSGVDVSGLRHSQIGRHGLSKGIIPLAKTLDWDTIYVNQGSRRPGALTISTRIHHYDTYEFISMVDKVNKDEHRLIKANTSIMLSDLFMKRCLNQGKWTLFCPKQTGILNDLHGAEFETLYLTYEKKAEAWKRYQKYCELKKLGDKSISSQYWDPSLMAEFDQQPPPERIDSRVYDADTLMSNICDMQLKSGMPYIVHGCNTNRKNNMENVGPVRSLNLCQEITIPAVAGEQTGSCNLASIALPAFVEDGQFQFDRFGDAVRAQVRALNKVIDKSYNMSDKVNRSNRLNRPIGIGVNGFSDMCYRLDLCPVDTEGLNDVKPKYDAASLVERRLNPKLADLNWQLWSCMYYHALSESAIIAKRDGAYPNFSTSPAAQGRLQYHLWQEEEQKTARDYPFRLTPDDPTNWGIDGSWESLIKNIQTHGLRNSLLLTCMPTASSAQLLGNCESTEFHMQNIYTRKVLSGDYPVLNFSMVNDLKQAGLWSSDVYHRIVEDNGSLLGLSEEGLPKSKALSLRRFKEKYLTMWEIPQKAMIQLAAQRQVFIDQSQSLNIYLARPNKETLKAIHTLTWKYGLKTGMYYLRSRGANEAFKIGQRQKMSDSCQMQDGCISCQ